MAVKEITHLNHALSMCGYPESWAFKKVKQELDQKAAEPKKSKTTKKDQPATKISVTIPYVKSFPEVLSRVFQIHAVATTMKSHQTLRRILVHPKDNREVRNSMGGVPDVVQVLSENLHRETKKRFGAREKEQRRDVNSLHWRRSSSLDPERKAHE